MSKRRPQRRTNLRTAAPLSLRPERATLLLVLGGFKLEGDWGGPGFGGPRPLHGGSLRSAAQAGRPRACLPGLGGGAAGHVAVFTSGLARSVPPPLPIGWPDNPGRAHLCARAHGGCAAGGGAGQSGALRPAPGALRSRRTRAGPSARSTPPCRPPAVRPGPACAQLFPKRVCPRRGPGSAHCGAGLMASTLGAGGVRRGGR